MPKQEQTITVSDTDKETILAISYQAIKNLGWTVHYAGEEKLSAGTIKKWNNYPQLILIESNGTTLTVSSEMVHGESFDIGGKNKKNIAAFLAAFEAAKNTTGAATIQENIAAINELRGLTVKVAEEEEANAAEIDKAMNLSGSNLYVTYTIIAINILIFILMAVNGAGIFEADSLVHVAWGSNFTPLTLSGDWWRLLTNTFLHFGVIHLLMNMYSLYSIGIYLEPMLGKAKYITAYLCTGVLASVVSVWWHKEGVNSAGASGAIFGMYGLFLALLTTNLIPSSVRKALLQSIGIFIVYNLAYGMKGGVDNAAHIGGLISGFIVGYIYAYGIKKERGEQQQELNWIMPLVIILTLGISYQFLQMHKVSAKDRSAEEAFISDSKYADHEKFNQVLIELTEKEELAINPLADTTITNGELKNTINTVCYPAWDAIDLRLKATKNYKISPSMHKKADKLLEYVGYRKEELGIRLKMIEDGQTEELLQELDSVILKINKVVGELQ
ncbi:rhomboid family intramembrane serine protease [Ferruginibacter sp. SUN002]|uniref:rhomboid family intramembrane serine protease n=1 Tax=Ferruginibacter sp. SUN002 TaxID=2937789 RepID=UPI003D36AD1E